MAVNNHKLTAKQEQFCQEYILDLNATQAYIRAGYSENGAAQSSAKILRNTDIHARITELQKSRLEKLQINQEWVLLRLMQVSDRSMQAEEVMKFDYETKSMIGTGEYVFDSNGANRATELIGKHLGMFKEKIEIEDKTLPALDKLSTIEKLEFLALQKKLRA